jgi:DNA-binding beta-propeller fold protein YncE
MPQQTPREGSSPLRLPRRVLVLGAATGLLAAAATAGVTAGPAAAGVLRVATVAAEPTAWAVSSPGGSTTLVGIDVATDTVVSTITIPNSIGDNVGSTADALAITPNGKRAYLAVQFADEVVPIDLGTGTLGKAIKVGCQPVSVAVTPNGSRAYILGYLNGSHARVVAINTSNGTAGKPVSVGPLESAGAGGIAVTPNGHTVWVSSSENGTVTPISVSSGKAGKPITVGAFPTSIAVTPNGRMLWVANSLDHDLVPVTLATSKVGKKVRLGAAPIDLSITPGGSYALATRASPANGADRVGLGGSHPVTRVRLTGLQVDSVAVDPAGKTALFGGGSAGVIATAAISTATETTPVTLGSGVTSVTAIAVTPDQAPTARFTVEVTGHTVSLNASASSAWFGTIARYSWAFGDGTSSTHGPTTTHRYSKKGTYTITLVVTDSLGTSTSVVFTGRTVSRDGGPRARKARTVHIS